MQKFFENRKPKNKLLSIFLFKIALKKVTHFQEYTLYFSNDPIGHFTLLNDWSLVIIHLSHEVISSHLPSLVQSMILYITANLKLVNFCF